MSEWLGTLTGWLSANPEWLGLAIFLIACIECLALIGILVPGVILLFSVCVLAGSGALSLGQTLLLAYSGGLLGDLLSYGLGRRFHQNIRRLPGLRQHPEWIGNAELYFRRYGVASLLAAAGWALAYIVPGWATGAALRLPLPEGFWGEAAVVAAGLALLLGLCLHSSLGGRRHTTSLAAGLSLALLLGLFVGWPHLTQFDQGLMTLVQAQRSASMDSLMVLITRLGDLSTQLAVGTLLTALLLLSRQWRAALFTVSALLGTALTNTALKVLFARTRPEVLIEPLNSFSFPSGHSSAAFAFFLVLGVLAGRGQPARMRLAWLVLASLPALAIALSRVYLGVHWPSDILAGALLAGGLCACSLLLVQRQQVLTALAPRAWWLLLPACLALLGSIATWALPQAMLQYRYAPIPATPTTVLESVREG